MLGALFHAGIQIPSIVADGFLIRFPRFYEPRALFHTLSVSVPRALALSMNQITFLGLTALAATLTSGSIAIFMFAYNLQAVPLAIIGASYSVAAFPTLAAALSSGQRAQFIEHVAIAARYVFFWSVPASMLILILRAYIVRVILGSGAFDWTDTRLTAAAFALFSLSLVAQGLTLLLVRGYYAAGRTFMPFLVSLGVAVSTLLLAFSLLNLLNNDIVLRIVQTLLRVQDIPGSSVLALAFSYAAVSIVGTIVLAIHFEHRFRGFFAQTRRALGESCLAGVAAAFSAYVALALGGTVITTDTSLSIFLLGSLGGISGIAMASLAYLLLGSREFAETYAAVHARLWRKTRDEGVTLVTSAEE